MEIMILESPVDVAERSAKIVEEVIRKKPNAVLGLVTGGTSISLYEKLVERFKAGKISFKKVTCFNLDEYVGLPPSHPRSYRFFMDEHLFKHIDIEPANTHVPPGNAENPMEAGPRYEKTIRDAGGIDLQILGIGTNGHIGFNEPTASLGSRTGVTILTQGTIADNSRFFGPDEFQPNLAVTMGIGTIMEARRIILMATGETKAEAVANACEGPVRSLCPASALQLHPATAFILDRSAAGKLTMKDYYIHVLKCQDILRRTFGNSR